MHTDKLIQRLAETSGPVSRLPPPSTRAAIWLGLAIPYVALVVFGMSLRDDLVAKLSDSSYLIEQIAALVTAITAAVAAFASIVPGTNRKILLLPLFPFAVWVGSLGLGCVQSWLRFGMEGLSLQPDWFCFPAILIVSFAPAIIIAFMLKRGAPLTPHLTTALGGLAAAGLGNFGLRFFHPQDASLMVLVWQMGTVFALTALAGSAGRLLLSWRSLTGNIRHSIASR